MRVIQFEIPGVGRRVGVIDGDLGAPNLSATAPIGTAPTRDLFSRDARGRTPLFDAAEHGRLGEVKAMLASLPGTGFYPQRLGLIEIKDDDGLTAADVAEQRGHKEIAELLRYTAWSIATFG